MTKLEELISLCEKGITVEINPHKTYYNTLEEYLIILLGSHEEVINDIGQNIYDEMIENDICIEIQAYHKSSITFYHVFHYDLEKALDEMIKLIKND